MSREENDDIISNIIRKFQKFLFNVLGDRLKTNDNQMIRFGGKGKTTVFIYYAVPQQTSGTKWQG